MTRLTTAILVLLISTATLAQQTRYVTDRLEITLRSGKSTQHKVVKMLRSGTPVTLLEEDEPSGYTRIKTNDGIEGWVITRYLLSQPVARDRLVKAEETINLLRQQMETSQSKLSTLSGTEKSLSKENTRLSAENKKLQQELARIRQTAANALTIDSENQSLKTRLFDLERENNFLHQQTEALTDRSHRDWFITGAGVLLSGLVMGFLFPKMRWRKKESWGSL